jgi:hypothetical protein
MMVDVAWDAGAILPYRSPEALTAREMAILDMVKAAARRRDTLAVRSNAAAGTASVLQTGPV